MSYFNMVCDSCGREVQGITWVNGMKFCAKCYQETFGNQKKYVDMLHKETGELLVNSLAEKDRQITELQKQLEEKEKEIEELQKDYEFKDKDCAINLERFCDALTKNVQLEFLIKDLQSELKSQPAEIVEKIRNICSIEDKCKDGSFVLGINEKDLDNLFKKYQK